MTPSRVVPLGALLAFCVLSALRDVLSEDWLKRGEGDLSPVFLLFVYSVVTQVVAAGFRRTRWASSAEKTGRGRSHLDLALLNGFTLLGFLTFFLAIETDLGSAMNAFVDYGTSPIFTAIGGFLLVGQRVERAFWASSVVSICGIAVLIFERQHGVGTLNASVLLGVGYAITSAVSTAVCRVLFSRLLAEGRTKSEIMLHRMWALSATLGAVLLFRPELVRPDLALQIALLGLVGFTVPLFMVLVIAERLRIDQMANLFFLLPVITYLLAWTRGLYEPTAASLLAMVAVCMAVTSYRARGGTSVRTDEERTTATSAETAESGRSGWRLAVIGVVALVVITMLWWIARPLTPDRIVFAANLSREEADFFRQELLPLYERDRARAGVRIRVELLNRDLGPSLEAIRANEQVDLLALDVNAPRVELSSELVPLDDWEDDLVPTSVHPSLRNLVAVGDHSYFVPLRANVRLSFVNEAKLRALLAGLCGPDASPPCRLSERVLTGRTGDWSWQDLAQLARALNAKMGPGASPVIVSAGGDDRALLLYELIRAAGGDACDLASERALPALELLREIWPYVEEPSDSSDWQTISGDLLAETAIVARNWTFAIETLHRAGREARFVVGPGWAWQASEAQRPRRFTLLGGHLMAIPKSVRHDEEARELMSFLTSRAIQSKMAVALRWKPMRLDARTSINDSHGVYDDTMSEALRGAEAVPEWWNDDVRCVYSELFNAVGAAKAASDLRAMAEAKRDELSDLDGIPCSKPGDEIARVGAPGAVRPRNPANGPKAADDATPRAACSKRPGAG